MDDGDDSDVPIAIVGTVVVVTIADKGPDRLLPLSVIRLDFLSSSKVAFKLVGRVVRSTAGGATAVAVPIGDVDALADPRSSETFDKPG